VTTDETIELITFRMTKMTIDSILSVNNTIDVGEGRLLTNYYKEVSLRLQKVMNLSRK